MTGIGHQPLSVLGPWAINEHGGLKNFLMEARPLTQEIEMVILIHSNFASAPYGNFRKREKVTVTTEPIMPDMSGVGGCSVWSG